MAGVLPARVASATAVGGPNGGSPVADVIQGATSIPGVGPIAASTLSAVVNGFFGLVDVLSGQEYRQDALAGLASLTTKGSADFTARFPAGMPAASNRCGEGA